MKLCIQVANVSKPNSRSNTIVLAIAKIKDMYENLSVIISLVKPKLEELEKVVWEGKKLVLFTFGDYDFYCKIVNARINKGVKV